MVLKKGKFFIYLNFCIANCIIVCYYCVEVMKMANYTTTLTIRCTPEQLKTWTQKAKDFDLSLNQFMRLAANTLIYTERPILRRYLYGDIGVVKKSREEQPLLFDEKITKTK